ncbi:MAG: PQQ-binding-like beta-propeller repeat protein, partial [Spirochaetota bacterium]
YNTLWAFDRDSGEEVWRHTFQDESWAGGMSSPTVGSDGTVYVNVTDVAFGSLHGVWAFDPDSTDNWTVSSAGDTGYAWWNSTDVAANELGNSSPALDESRGVLYVGRGADETGAGNHHYLYALSTATGALEWKFSTDPLTIYASPAVGSDGTVYAGTTSKPLSSPDQAGVFYAINPDGSELWRYDTSPDVEGARDIYTGAAVGDDGTVYFTNENRYLYALDGSTGAVVRKYDLKNLVGGTAEGAVVHSSPALGPDGTIYVGEFYYTFTQDGVPVSAGYVEENPGGDIDHTGAVYALDCSSGGLASSPWPAFRYDQQNSGSR